MWTLTVDKSSGIYPKVVMCLQVFVSYDCLFAFNIEAYDYFSDGFNDFAHSAYLFRDIWHCVLSHIPTKLQLKGLLWNLILQTCMKICWNIENLFIIGQIIGQFTWRTQYVLYCWQQHIVAMKSISSRSLCQVTDIFDRF